MQARKSFPNDASRRFGSNSETIGRGTFCPTTSTDQLKFNFIIFDAVTILQHRASTTTNLDIGNERAELAREQTAAAPFKNQIAQDGFVRTEFAVEVYQRELITLRERLLTLVGERWARLAPKTARSPSAAFTKI
jgi:hypothetical protein